MGQRIEVIDVDVIDEVAIFECDRSFTGMEGEAYATLPEAEAAGTVPGDLAARILKADSAIRSVYVYGNDVSVSRAGGWVDGALDRIRTELVNFFVVYDENKA